MIPPGYFDLVRRRESGGNDNAQNSLSSASGRYQFTDSTFVNTMMPLMPGKSRQDILALKNDPNVQDQAMQAFTMGNANALKNAGFDPTPQNLYLAHHYGAGGATKLLQAAPNTPLNQIFGPEVFKANPYMNNIADAQGLINKWSGQGGGGTMNNFNPQAGAQTVYEGDQQGFNLSNFFGNNLVNAGAALASINSPAAAAALGKLAQSNDQDFQTSIDPSTGQIVRVNKKSGQTQIISAPQLAQARQAADQRDMDQRVELYNRTVGAAAANKPYDPPKFLLERWDENDQISAAARSNLSELGRFTEALNSGMLDPTLLGKSKAELSTLAGKNDPKANLAFEFKGFLEKLRNDSLRANKGMQTEGDAIRAMNEFISGTGQFNPYTTQAGLSRFAVSVADQGLFHTKKNEEYLGRGDKIKNYFDRDGLFTEEFANRKREFESARQTFDERRKSLSAPGAGANVQGETQEQRQQRLRGMLQ
jgi:hypothetical protein